MAAVVLIIEFIIAVLGIAALFLPIDVMIKGFKRDKKLNPQENTKKITRLLALLGIIETLTGILVIKNYVILSKKGCSSDVHMNCIDSRPYNLKTAMLLTSIVPLIICIILPFKTTKNTPANKCRRNETVLFYCWTILIISVFFIFTATYWFK